MAQKRLFLIDTFGFIFRAYHARARSGAPPMRTSTGISTEAIFIFNNMLRKLMKTYKPTWIAAVFESIGPTLREQEFAAYKANRTEMPPDLTEQLPYIRRTIEAMHIPILEYAGFEADDVIGTISRRAEADAGEFWAQISTMGRNQVLQLFASILHRFIAESSGGQPYCGPSELRLGIAGFGGGPVPQRRFRLVERGALAEAVHAGEVEHRRRVALPRPGGNRFRP